MRFAWVITFGGEACGIMSSPAAASSFPGVVLAGAPLPGDTFAAIEERYSLHGFALAHAAVQPALALADGVPVVRDAIAALRATCARVAVAGYGFGGAYAFLGVTQLDADAGVAFCGAGIGALLADARRVRAPLSFHFADDDAHVPFAEVRAIKGALEGFGMVEIYRYATFDAASAAAAERRAFAVLDALRGQQG